jgi:uncharacterized protein (TIGR03437 family)
VVNAASYAPADFPGGAIAQGSIFAVFGAALGPANPLSASASPLQKTLGGVSITVTQGATTVNAIPLYVSATQVNAIMPSNAPIGAVQVVVKYNNLSSLPSTAQVAKTNVALFTIPFSGMGPGAIVNFVNGAVSPVNSLTAPATPNQTEYLFGTGLGASLNGDDTNPPQKGSLPVGVTVRVGNKSVAPSYSGRSSCCAGEDEITFTVPPDTLLGCYVPVQVVTSDGTPSNVATMAISSDGSPCKDAANPYGTAVAGKPGTVLLERVVATAGSGAVAVSTTLDTMLASFRQETGGPFAYNPMYSLPPAGSCSAYLAAGDPTDEAQAQFFVLTGKALDAGPLTVNNGTTSAGPTEANGLYVGLLGQSSPGDQSGAFLTGGPYVVSGAGGLDVGSFHVTLGDPPGNTWTTGDGSTVVNRANGLTVNWSVTGGDPSKLLAIVMGANADSVDSRTEIFTCTANAGDGTLTVPPAILSRIPVTRGTVGLSMGAVVVGMLPLQPQATFSATGLDYGFADSIGLSAQFVTFQ